MDGLSIVLPLRELVLLLGLSTARVAAAFLLVPLFTADLIPATVRNAMFLAIALMTLLMQPAAGPLPAGFALVSLYAKEAFIGGVLGLLFAGVMWAFEIAGQLIDTKVGMSQAQVADPHSGHQTTLTGALFARLASWVFMASGGFMVMMAALFESYSIWPVLSPMPTLAVLVSAPALVLLYAVDVVLGLVNRFAQQLNVFSLSMSLKAVAAAWIVLIQLASLVQLLQDDLLSRGGIVLRTLRVLFGQ